MSGGLTKGGNSLSDTGTGADSHTKTESFCSKEYNSISKSQSRFELKIVYRILRKISDWSLSGFFSKVCVKGSKNVPSDGAVILTPCHHNEILDIATLSATIPHRRIISYWAKASMFKNLISGFILDSAGAIPVERSTKQSSSSTQTNDNSSLESYKQVLHSNHTRTLFEATYDCLSKDGVLAIFPEGTSYTMPRIVQVKEGAARAALGFVKHLHDKKVKVFSGDTYKEETVQIIPVGIVCTDKSKYRNRTYIEYGQPIPLAEYVEQFLLGEEREAVERLTAKIEKRLVALTINAPDWETLYSANMARDILYADEVALDLEKFTEISQGFIDKLSETASFSALYKPSTSIKDVKMKLLHYHGLLHHSHLSHDALRLIPDNLVPEPTSATSTMLHSHKTIYCLVRATFSSVLLPLPSLMLSSPVHLVHLPGYMLGSIASSQFAGEEEEARAQFKAILGGFGFGIGLGTGGWLGVGLLKKMIQRDYINFALRKFGIREIIEATLGPKLDFIDEWCGNAAEFFTRCDRLGEIIGAFMIAWMLCAWHERVIDKNYKRYKRLRAYFAILAGVLFPGSSLREDELKPYLITPLPAANPFVAKALSEPAAKTDLNRLMSRDNNTRKIPARRLVLHLLRARAEAVNSVSQLFGKIG